MLSILLSWIYITAISYCIGWGFHGLLQKKVTGKEEPVLHHFSIISISGLLVTIFLCNILCLFIPLGLLSNLIVLIIAFLSALFSRNGFRKSVAWNFALLRNTPWLAFIAGVFYLLVLLHLSYTPSSHNDDGLYYSTSIKWLQEYGTVKGLANINPRIAFNSSWLVLQSHYGFQFINKGVFNDLNGLLLFYFLIYACGGIIAVFKGATGKVNLLRSLLVLPALLFHHTASSDFMLFNINFLSSPTADFPAVLLIWLVLLLFVKANEERELPAVQIRTIDLLIVFYTASLLTIKLIAIPLLILVLFYTVFFLRNKRWVGVIFTFLLCFLVLVPWILRNILLSGYVLFPLSVLDFMQVDWKLPIENVYWHENAVKEFAISGAVNESIEKITLLDWFPGWLEKQNYINIVILFFTFINTITYLLIIIYQLNKNGIAFLKSQGYLVTVLCTGLAGILLWFFKGPDFRFGYGFIIFYNLLGLTLFFIYFLAENLKYMAWVISAAMISLLWFTYRADITDTAKDFFKQPLSYRMPQQMKAVKMNSTQTIYLVNGADIWNAPLPATTESEYYYITPLMRGATIKDGFKARNQKH